MRYFITGATGFIGKRLVRKLLASKDSEICFLIREESRDKLPDLLDYWGADQSRAIPVFGNVRAAKLGISDQDLKTLSGTVDHFFHLAAIYDLRAGAAPQVATNVEGTRNAVTLAAALRAGCFQHVSSVAAAGLYEGMFREDMFDEAEQLWHPYFATKHAGEKVVRDACAVPWRVYRPGPGDGRFAQRRSGQAGRPLLLLQADPAHSRHAAAVDAGRRHRGRPDEHRTGRLCGRCAGPHRPPARPRPPVLPPD